MVNFVRDDILYYGGLVLGAWVVGWYLIYLVSGFHLKTIGINNGILFNGISYSNKKVSLTLRSFRFRLWGNSRKIVMDDLVIKLHSGDSNTKGTKTPEKKEDCGNESLDLAIFPSNWIARVVVRFILGHVPGIDIGLKHMMLIHPDSTSTTIEYLRFMLVSRYSKKSESDVKFYTTLVVNDVTNSSESDSLKLVPPLSLQTLKVQLNLLINMNQGNVHNIQVRLFTDEFKCVIFRTAKLFIDRIKRDMEFSDKSNEPGVRFTPETKNEPKFNYPEEETSKQEDAGSSKLQTKFDKFIKIRNKLYPVIKEISFSLDNSELLEIPFAITDKKMSFSDYFDYSSRKRSLNLFSKSISFNYLKLNKTAAGYHVLFDSETDDPFQVNTSIQSLKINYCKHTTENGKTTCRKDEILNIPNFNYTYKSNILDCMVRDRGFEHCVTEFAASACSPMIDLNTAQLATLIYNCVLIKKYFTLKQLKKRNKKMNHEIIREHTNVNDTDSDGDDIDTTQVDSDTNDDLEKSSRAKYRHKLLKLLKDFFPKVDTKFVIEQPRIILRHHDKVSGKVQILDFSYSLLNLHTFTTSTRDYNINCHVIHPCVNYVEKTNLSSKVENDKVIKKEILSFRSINFRLDILKNIEVKSTMAINEPRIDLSQLNIITGINDLLQDITCMAREHLNSGLVNLNLNAAIIKQRLVFPNMAQKSTSESASLEYKLFRYLPDWFLGLEISISKLSFILGSRSVLIAKDYLDEINGEGFNADFFPDNHKLRNVRFTIDRLDLNIKNKFYDPDFNINSDSTDTLPTSENTTVFWTIDMQMSKVQFALQLLLNKSDDEYSELLNMPMTDIFFSAVNFNGINDLKVDVSIEDIVGNYNRYKLSILIGAIYLVREAILSPVKVIKNKLRNDMQKVSSNSSIQIETQNRKLSDFLVLACRVKRSNFELYLDDNYRVKLQLHDLIANASGGVLDLHNKFFRILADSPFIAGHWCRIACVDDLKITFNDPSSESKINLSSESIRLIQPHGFVVYRLFDNLSITIKILKHLITCLKNDNIKRKSIEPKESKAINLPPIRIKSKKLSFSMEDDPFECELNMIYQLGLVEQRKRLEQMSLFEGKTSKDNLSKAETISNSNKVDEKLFFLRKSISTSWIRKVKIYKAKLSDEIIQNKKFLFGNEASLPVDKNERIIAYMNQAPLLSVIVSHFDLNLSSTKFELKKLPQFIHDIGQGVPLDTRYSLMIPMFISLQLSELRMHLRDYPLPLLRVPYNKDKSSTLSMAGHLILSEALENGIEHLRNLHIPLVPDVKNIASDKHYALTINKSLSSVKLYTDLSINFSSNEASRFVWGQSYQFGIQQVMLNFDQFSKPPVDPSSKLGFWDKMRYIIHGKFRIETGQNNSLEAAFKGSRDPYDLFNVSSGFVLAFNDDVLWTVNENDDSQLFMNVKSDKVLWYIPNYLATPLVSWSRDSSKYIYLPNSKSFLSSCFGYFLEDTPHDDSDVSLSKSHIYEKKVVSLKGGVNFSVGFLLQRDTGSEITSRELKHHYDIKLFNPEYTKENHDSYAGFRSDHINMSISFHANTENSYNCIHLSPGTFKQFFSWWTLFAGNMMIPVRRGNLFGDSKKSMKFSQHLFSNKFQFNFKSLFITHMYRDENVDANEDKIECVGVRAKMDEFLVDLHQVKEPRIMVHEGLSKNKKIMKMNFRIGEVHLTGIDLRTVHAAFDQDVYERRMQNENRKSKFEVFDNDAQWFDIEDYEEAFLPTLRKSRRSIKINALMYSKRFSYLRDTTNQSNEVVTTQGDDDAHGCLLGSKNIYSLQIDILKDRIRQLEERININKSKQLSNEQLYKRIEFLKNYIKEQELKLLQNKDKESNSSESNFNSMFHNKFVLVCMFLKWNVQNRNLLYKYVHFVQLKVQLRKYLSYESIRAIHNIIDSNIAETGGDEFSLVSEALSRMKLEKLANAISGKAESSQQRLNSLDSIIRKTNENQRVSEDFLIEILYPQIQLQSDETPNNIVLVAAPSIDAKIVSVLTKSGNQLVVNERELENRYGVILREANIFVLNKEDVLNVNKLILNKRTYGSTTSWPPWLGVEICKNGKLAGEDKLIVEKTSMLITYDQINPLGNQLINDNEGNYELEELEDESISKKVNVNIPEFKILSTAKQYHTLYVIVLHLLFYVEPKSKSLSEKLEKLKFSIDFLDLIALNERLINLHKYYRLMNILSNNYGFRQGMLDNEGLNEHLMLNVERGNTITEIYLLMNSLLTGELFNDDSNSKTLAEWNINADSIQLCMLEDDRTPILEILMDHGKYRRRINENGSNDNRIEIENMQGSNLLHNAYYDKIMEPLIGFSGSEHDESENLITVDWSMKRSIGGIKVLDYFSINSQPLNIKIDEITGEKLLRYIFPSGSDNENYNLFGNTNDEDDQSDTDEDDNHKNKRESFVQELDASKKVVTFQDDNSGSSNRGSQRNQMKFDRSMTRLSNNKLQLSSSLSSNDEGDADLDEMFERSKKYLSIGNLNISPICLLISVKCHSGYKKILNVQDLFIKLPEFTIGNQVLSLLEVTMKFKKMIKKALLSHIGRLLRNKMTVKKNKIRNKNDANAARMVTDT
ncbi:unnamed protein product [Debaryomyces fabryi]|nr:unnamed protein product [Debaryomyces fabryi]